MSVLSKPGGVIKRAAPASFFAPRKTGRNTERLDYANIQRREANPQNPPRAPPTSSTPSTANGSPEDTIEVAVPGDPDYDSDHEMEDSPEPTFANITLTEAEKMEAIKQWAAHRAKHTRKKKEKNSHVYYYMKRETIYDSFYTEKSSGIKCLQEYRWKGGLCLAQPELLRKPFEVYESKRHGATSGMGLHLKTHGITPDVHFARMNGYSQAIGGGDHTELDTWAGRKPERARLTSREATRRCFVKTRQPFSAVESPEFQEMFLAHGQRCIYRNRVTLRNDVYDDFLLRRDNLIRELDINCVSISFTLDMWTSPNRTPIFAIIGHWYTPDFEEREEVLEFIEIHGSHTGEVLAEAVEKILEELKIKHKLFAITGDNAGNNSTLCQALYISLKRKYDDRVSPIGRPQMRFHGKQSWVRCLAHVIALICKDVLNDVKAGSAKEAKKMLDSWDAHYQRNDYVIPNDDSRSAVAKVRLLNLWILRGSSREQDWKTMPKTKTRRPIYDVDTRWNSAYDMIEQFLELEAEYTEFIRTHPQVKCLLPTNNELVALYQLTFVLRPFKQLTLKVSESMPSLARSLEVYWDIDDLLDKVIGGKDKYGELDPTIRDAFKAGKAKHLKYTKLKAKNAMIFAAHILDPRCKTSMIADMMPGQCDTIISMVKKYMITEWPALAEVQIPDLQPVPFIERPDGMSIAHWKAIQNKHARDREAGLQAAISELDRWLQSAPLDWDERVNNDPDFLRKWWKEQWSQWPQLAEAARDLLPCSASEVDVERLFSGCRDEYGIRRHALKAETVRVMTLLRSAYGTEDKADKRRIQKAYELSLGTLRYHVLYRPDQIDGRIENNDDDDDYETTPPDRSS